MITGAQKAFQKVKDEKKRRDALGAYGRSVEDRGRAAGLEGPALNQFTGMGQEQAQLRQRQRRSDAAQAIMAQQQELAGAQRGVAAAQRGPFAGAGMQSAERAIGQTGAAAASQAAQADAARMGQIDQQMQQMQYQGELMEYQKQQQQKQLEEQRKGAMGGLLGGLAGAGLGALGFMAGGPLGAALGTSLMGAGGQFGGGLGQMISDERMKSNVKDGSAKAQQFLDEISAKEYDVNGKRDFGVMAQDLPEDMVKDMGGIKTIPQGFGKVIAALGQIDKRLKKIEETTG